MGQRFSSKAIKRIRSAVKRIESGGGSTAGGRRAGAAPSGRPIGIGVMVATILPNSWGTFKKAKGSKGEEEAFGETYPCYYRAKAETPAIEADSLVYWVFIGDGYEVSPVECPENE